MWPAALLQGLKSDSQPTRRDRGRRPQRRQRLHFVPRLEPLEGRALPSFITAPSYPVGVYPVAVAVGDFNRDGVSDLAVANRDSQSVSILLANGDGTFRPEVNYATGTAISVAVGDFNGDGRPDLAVALPGPNTVGVLLGNGDGTFQPAVNYAAGSLPNSVAVGDFNRDGAPDLAVANNVSNTVTVLRGSGDGSFQAAGSYGVGSFPIFVAVGDFNRDGTLDLAVANFSSNSLSVLRGTGDGTFQPAVNYPVGSLPTSVAVGDFNRDGAPDLAVGSASSATVNVRVLLGNGDGSFQAAVSYDVGSAPRSVAVADFNGDGNLDLAVANETYSGTVRILLGQGDGTFQAPVGYVTGEIQPRAVAVGDFNRDGTPDLAVANPISRTVSVLLGKGDGTFPAPASYIAGSSVNSVAVAVGDFNGDGTPDVAVLNSLGNGTVSVLLARGDGTFQTAQNFSARGWNSLAVGDFNGDGRPDLATTASVYLGNGDGTFQPSIGYGPGGSSVAVGEFNGDGLLDLAVADLSNTVSVFLGNGDGTFLAARTFPTGMVPKSVAVGDFNRDGHPDLAVANNVSDTVSVLLGRGDGTFQAAVNYAVDVEPTGVAVGDFNGDGFPDLAVSTRFFGTVSVLLGRGDGTFLARTDYAAGNLSFSVTVADFNGDGTPDLALANRSDQGGPGGRASVLLGRGDGTFLAPASYPAGFTPMSVAVGDFNGDGFPDLALANFEVNTVTVLLNDPLLTVTSLTPTPTGFALQFNRSFAPGALNLYDTASAGLGPADVTLVGSTTGPVSGSLVVQAASNRITFVRTGGVLPPDTYTVTLRSAANGFRTPADSLLDGNGDNIPGGNYVATFPVAVSSAVVVSVPDVMRGPGQPVNVPADRTGLPLRLSNGSGVTAVSLTLAYDPASLRITGAAVAAGLPAGATVSLNTATAGQAVLTFSSPTPLPAGPLDFITLTAAVPDNAPYAAKEILNITNLTVNGAAARDDDGIHIVGYFGDTTGNAGYSSADATRALRVAVGVDSGFDAWQLADPVLIADVTGNGVLNTTDATRILQEALGLDRPEIPPPGSAPPFTPGGPDPFLNLPTHFKAAPGGVLTVPVLLDLSDGLESADLAISFDPTRLEVVKVQRGDLTGDFDLFAVNLDAHNGTLRVGLGRSAGPLSGQGSGSVISITFRVRDDAPAGPTVLNLRQGLGGLTTQLNEGGLDLIPYPSDEEGDVLDGQIMVLDKGNKPLPPWDNGRGVKETSQTDLTDAVFAMLAGRQRRNTILQKT